MADITLIGAIGVLVDKVRALLADGELYSFAQIEAHCGENPERALQFMFQNCEVSHTLAGGYHFWQSMAETEKAAA